MTHQAHTVKINHQFAERRLRTTLQDHEWALVAHGKHVIGS